ncbi:hypothetical protein [Candidatus Nitrosocosmicus sp. FF01]
MQNTRDYTILLFTIGTLLTGLTISQFQIVNASTDNQSAVDIEKSNIDGT